MASARQATSRVRSNSPAKRASRALAEGYAGSGTTLSGPASPSCPSRAASSADARAAFSWITAKPGEISRTSRAASSSSASLSMRALSKSEGLSDSAAHRCCRFPVRRASSYAAVRISANPARPAPAGIHRKATHSCRTGHAGEECWGFAERPGRVARPRHDWPLALCPGGYEGGPAGRTIAGCGPNRNQLAARQWTPALTGGWGGK